MEPRFTRGEYWLLESVVNCSLPIGMLDDAELEIALNKKGHGLSQDDLLQTLEGLFAAGLIEASRRCRFGSDDVVLGKLSSTEIELALKGKEVPDSSGRRESEQGLRIERTHYQLTAEGGAAWEAFAAPDWNRFVDASSTMVSDDLKDGCWEEVICADRKLLECYFHSSKRLKVDVDETSIVWDELRPWQATYWKELQVGHRVRFRYLCDCSSQPDWYKVATAEDVRTEHYLMWLNRWWYHWQ